MEIMSAEKLKRKLKVKVWSEITTPEQFLQLMQYFYRLSPRLQNKVLGEMNNLGENMEKFLKHCIDGIVDYEPSIMIAIIDKWVGLKQTIEAESVSDTPKARKKRMDSFVDFSEWFSENGEVKCTSGFKEVICSISDAIKLAIKNNEAKEHDQIDMLLLTDARKLLSEKMEAMRVLDIDADRDMLLEYLGEDADILEFLDQRTNRYLN